MAHDIIFETDRLYFRLPRAEDADMLILAANSIWEDIRKFMSFGQAESYDYDQAIYYLNVICPDQIAKDGLPLLGFRKDSDEFVIAGGLTVTDSPHTFATGYWISENQQRQGFATEATKATLHYAFNIHGAVKIIISYYEGNHPSLRVIEKCGFDFLETRESYALSHATGEMVDEHFYDVTKEKYLTRELKG